MWLQALLSGNIGTYFIFSPPSFLFVNCCYVYLTDLFYDDCLPSIVFFTLYKKPSCLTVKTIEKIRAVCYRYSAGCHALPPPRNYLCSILAGAKEWEVKIAPQYLYWLRSLPVSSTSSKISQIHWIIRLYPMWILMKRTHHILPIEICRRLTTGEEVQNIGVYVLTTA